MARIGVIDYGMGNIRSVTNALSAVGATACVVNSPPDLDKVSGVVLPGVGAFGVGIRNLERSGMAEALGRYALDQGRPLLGICLGIQLLARIGTEHGVNNGLGWIPGRVVRMEQRDEIRIPHIGWNDVGIVSSSGLFKGLKEVQTFYFVHSFVLQPEDSSIIVGRCEHGSPFSAAIQKDNVWATQFHPEKSHKAGLAVLNNFHQQVL